MKAKRTRSKLDAVAGEEGAEAQLLGFDEGEVTIREVAFVTFGKRGMYFSDFVVISAQVFSVVAFVAFISQSLASVFNTVDAHMETVVDSSTGTRDWTLVGLLPVLAFLCALKSTASLELLASAGNFVFLASFVTVRQIAQALVQYM